MPFAVFDIDGTRTDTMEVDVACYEAAVRAKLGLDIPEDWPEGDEVTDDAILETACRRAGRPVPAPHVQDRIADRVAQLRNAGWKVAMATGAWRPSVTVELRAAEVPFKGVVLARSSDHRSRAVPLGTSTV